MFLVQIGEEMFNPESIVQLRRLARDDGEPALKLVLSGGDPIVLVGEEARAFMRFAGPSIHRLEAPEPVVEQAPGLILRPERPGQESKGH